MKQMRNLVMAMSVFIDGARRRRVPDPSDDRGEGVISTAIAVLIVAFLGAAMWLFFDGMWTSTSSNISDQVGEIGTSTGGGPVTGG